MNLIETSYKVCKVMRSAKTIDQHRAAAKYSQLFREHVARETEKINPLREALTMVGVSFFAFIGLLSVLQMVYVGILD